MRIRSALMALAALGLFAASSQAQYGYGYGRGYRSQYGYGGYRAPYGYGYGYGSPYAYRPVYPGVVVARPPVYAPGVVVNPGYVPTTRVVPMPIAPRAMPYVVSPYYFP